MRYRLTIAAMALPCFTVLTPLQAQTAVQLVRAGDGTMTCEALASEINALAAQQAPQVAAEEAAAKKKRRVASASWAKR